MEIPMTELVEEQTAYKYPHVVKAALDQEVSTESGAWRLADALFEDVGELRGSPGLSGVNTGLHARIEEAYLEAKRAGAHELQPRTLIRHYSTARAWPPETRISQASFSAHRELRGLPHRQSVLARLADRSSDGWVSARDAQRWKSDRKPRPEVVPFLDQVERAVRGALKRKVHDWSRLSDGDRDAIARMLNEIRSEVLAGEFGRGRS
jgi:hypothetical protein